MLTPRHFLLIRFLTQKNINIKAPPSSDLKTQSFEDHPRIAYLIATPLVVPPPALSNALRSSRRQHAAPNTPHVMPLSQDTDGAHRAKEAGLVSP